MPINKDQLRRIKGIDSRLNRWNRTKRNRLARIFEVTERTIQRDIQLMKDEYEAPISFDSDGLFYTEKFSLPLNLTLTGDEINQLKLAVKTLNQFQHLEAFQGLEGLIEKIEHSVNFKLPESHTPLIHFESIPHYEGTELIEFFLQAIQAKQIVSFNYHSFKTDSLRMHAFNPYALKEHTNRWYVIGYLAAQKAISAFALDRIVLDNELTLLDSFFTIPSTFNIKSYFKYTYGMTVLSEGEIEKILISFSPLQAKYFKSKPFHEYKIIEETQNSFIIEMSLIINYELIRKLASFGVNAKILAPKLLQKQVLKFHEDAIDMIRLQ